MPEAIDIVTGYHIDEGPQRLAFFDLNNAVRDFPLEWSLVPWTAEMRAQVQERRAREAAVLAQL